MLGRNPVDAILEPQRGHGDHGLGTLRRHADLARDHVLLLGPSTITAGEIVIGTGAFMVIFGFIALALIYYAHK
jgi:hypothetical protein